LFNIKKIRNVHTYTDLSTETKNNVTVIEENNGLTIIDTFMKEETMKCFLDIVAGYNKPIYRIILTHWHIDHTIGACMISTELIASNECKVKLENFILNHQQRLKEKGIIEGNMFSVIPSTVFKESMSIELDNNEKLYLKAIPGHSFDSVIILYKEFLFVGDNLVGETIDVFLPPVILPDKDKSEPRHLINSIKYIEEKKAKYIICGHGELEETEKLIEHNKKRIAQLMKEID